jgi:hypothetical protein
MTGWPLMSNSITDARTPIADSLRRQIAQQLDALPEDKRGALVIVADDHGARAHLAARLGEGWKIAFEAGKAWDEPAPTWSVGVAGAW